VSERGTVKWFDERRGYGFIGREGAVDVFVHASAVEADRPLRPGDLVEFVVEEGRRGLQARGVRLAATGPPPPSG
jgi:CspA family cold shock protein